MPNDPTGVAGLPRRAIVKLLAAASIGSTAATGFASGDSHTSSDEYEIVQGDRSREIQPLSGDVPVEEFYDLRIPDSYVGDNGATDPDSGPYYISVGTQYLQRESTTLTFLYDGPNGLSLVIVHDAEGGDGGSATMRFSGTLDDARWRVKDDLYIDPDTGEEQNFDRWSIDRVDWTWSYRRGDGGVLGYLTDALELTITPAFNEDAALFEEHYSGTVDAWEFLTGDRDEPDRIRLRLDEPIEIRRRDADDDGTDRDDDDDETDRDDDEDRDRDHDEEEEDGDDDDDDEEEQEEDEEEEEDGDDDDDDDDNDDEEEDDEDDDDDDNDDEEEDDEDDDDEEEDDEVESRERYGRKKGKQKREEARKKGQARREEARKKGKKKRKKRGKKNKNHPGNRGNRRGKR